MAFKWPDGLDEEDQMLLGIGALIASASTLEWFFFVVLQCLTEREGQRHCEAIWLSHRSTYARMQMVLAAAKLNKLDAPLLHDIQSCAAELRGISRLRNFYGHARYARDEESKATFEGFEIVNERDIEDPLVIKTKEIGWPALKELREAIDRADRLYVRMIPIAHRLRDHTGAQHVTLPQQLPTNLLPDSK